MPELPEVESVARNLRDSRPPLVGAGVVSVTAVWPGVVSPASLPLDGEGLKGCCFVSVGRRGKYLLLQIEHPQGGPLCLVIHLRMTGRLCLVPQEEAVERHTRLALMLDNGRALRFDDPRKFGRVWLSDDADAVTGSLGPDALDVPLQDFAARLAARRRQVKPLLLDQSFVAGIGNIYADESLHRAGIHPCTVTSELSPDRVRRLHAAVISVLGEAVAAQGANIDGVFKAGSFVVSVYGRDGQACRTCGTSVAKIRVGQRGTHFCPHCQRL
jgi:formamidopyrimidine-DNA glycosylase